MINLTMQEKVQLSDVLSTLADAIDLTEAQYKLAIDRYNAVGEYLSSSTSLLHGYKPVIRSQGSFRTGTPVRPVHEDAEFDVDLTCLLQVTLPHVQAKIKALVGDQLKLHEKYKAMLREKRRCWRLKYAEASRFHLDIVTAIPDNFQWLLDQGVAFKYAQHAINITDKERYNYTHYTSDFPKSNPEGYALWFLDIMKIEADRIRMALKSQLLLERVEDVPDYKVRTPLQRGVQLMKRHRDIMYDGTDDCPISIIISTLAARAYAYVLQHQPSGVFYEVLVRMTEMMPAFIENRAGIKWIPNPVNPKENFADKWQENKQKERDFYTWHTAFHNTLQSGRIQKGFTELGALLKEGFGTRAVNEALNKIGNNTLLLRQNGQLRTSATGILGLSGTLIKNHTFDGNDER